MPPTPRTRQIASPGRMGIISSSSVDARPRGGSEREGSDATRAHLIHELIRRVLDLIPRSHARGRRARGERGAAVAVVASEPRRACRGDVARATLDVGRTAERQLSRASRRVASFRLSRGFPEPRRDHPDPRTPPRASRHSPPRVVMQTRSKKRNDALASTPPPSDAPPSLPLDGVVACGVLSRVASGAFSSHWSPRDRVRQT